MPQASQTARGDLFTSLLAVRKAPASPEPFVQPSSISEMTDFLRYSSSSLSSWWRRGSTITHFQDLATQESTRCPFGPLRLPAVQVSRQKASETETKKADTLHTWWGSFLSWWAGRSSSCRATVTCRNHRGWGAAGLAGLWNSGSSSGALCGCNVSEDRQSGKRRVTR